MTADELKAHREALRLSQIELARSLGVAANTVNRWEAGTRKIPPYLRLTLVGLGVELQRVASSRIVNAYADSDTASRTT